MPYSDPERQRKAAREWAAAQRAEWLAEHPCHCGRPSVGVVAHKPGGVPKGVFGWRPERRDPALVDCGAAAVCAVHKASWLADQAEALADRMRAQATERRAADTQGEPRRVHRAKAVSRSEVPVPPPEPEHHESDLPPLRKPKRVRAGKLNGPTDSELAEEAEAQRVDRRKWRAQRRKRMGYGR